MSRLEHRLLFWLLDRFIQRNITTEGKMPHLKLLTKHYYLWADNGGIRGGKS